MSFQVVLVVGTRPEAIKLAPLAEALDALGIAATLIFTGQHRDLQPTAFGLDGFASFHLDCPGVENPHAHVRSVTKALLPLLGGTDMVIVQGDTSSALAGALGGKFARVPVAHVEAGLRSHDRHRPWPEEDFRMAIDSHADLLFAPTELSVANLRRERVRGRIHLTGNTGIDAALRTLRSISAPSVGGGRTRLLVTCHRRESWGEGLVSIAAALRHLARSKIAAIDFIHHPNPAVAAQIRLLLGNEDGVRLVAPCPHGQLLAAMLRSDLVLTDSGGMQEEAAAFGIALVILRDKTERPEAIASGHLVLGSLDPDRIVECVARHLSDPRAKSPAKVFGDGTASERIATIVHNWLHEKTVDLLEEDRPRYPPLLRTAANRLLAT